MRRCVRCGICKAECPTYNASFDESETARGRLGLLYAFTRGALGPSKKLNEKIFGCLLCGNCSRLCPLGIDLEELFYYARGLLRFNDKERKYLRFLSSMAFENTDFTVKMTKPIHGFLTRALSGKGILPENISISERDFRNVAIFRPEEKVGRVAVFTGCTIKHIYPDLSISLINVLNALKYEVVFPNTETCCGAPFRSLGMDDRAAKYAERNFKVFNTLNVDAIVSLCPTCVIALDKYYPQLIGKKLDNVFDISVFLMDNLKKFDKRLKGRVVYHDPCHLANILAISRQPRELIEMTGLTLLEPSGRRCCGFGGAFSYSFPEASGRILNDTSEALLKTEPQGIVTSCPNCILQLSKAVKEMQIYHIVEIIEDAFSDDL